MSRVPQGSVLGPLFFITFIKGVDERLVSLLAKFAIDMRLGANIVTPENIEGLREDVWMVGKWSDMWQMPFNLDKCKVMHLGYANHWSDCELQGMLLESTVVEKDLAVLISSDFKISVQCSC